MTLINKMDDLLLYLAHSTSVSGDAPQTGESSRWEMQLNWLRTGVYLKCMASHNYVVCSTYTCFFIRNLAPETSTQFLMKMAFFEYSVSSRFLIRARFARFSCKKYEVSRKNRLTVSYALGTWVLGFLTVKKFEYWFLIKRFLIKKTCVHRVLTSRRT